VGGVEVRHLVTPHFAIEEWACRDGTPYPIACIDDEDPQRRAWYATRLLPACELLEVVRDEANAEANMADDVGGLVIDSGYRTPKYDELLYERHVVAYGDDGLVAPASRSQHPQGRAVDVRHVGPRALGPLALFNLITGLYERGRLPRLGGVGLYPSFVHVDVRPRPGATDAPSSGHLAIWGGRRPTNVA
jgi:hypothetical protein